MIKKANEAIENVPETVFDKFKIRINLKSVGRGLRDDLADIFNQYGRINEIASNALFNYERAKIRKDKVYAQAYTIVNSDPANIKMKVDEKKSLIKIVKVNIDGESTTLVDEENRVALYNFLYNRGRDKIREISCMLDLGRTILSFDKSELDRIA